VAAIPSIKGSVFGGVVDGVIQLLERKEISEDDLARWLEPEDVALLDQQILVANWYDIRSYDRMNALLLEVAGGGDTEFFRQQGRETALRLLEGGLYSQLEYLRRVETQTKTDELGRYEAFGRDLRLLASLSASILNFSRWTSRPDPDAELRYLIDVTEASAFPDSLCWRSDGFVNGMAEVHDRFDMWRWERTAPDRIVFRMRYAV